MRKTNMNIPAVLVHSVNGVLYKLQGTLIAINESNDTCSMKIKGKVEENLPMEKIFINEGFIDKIKEYGSKVYNWVVAKVNGFLVAKDEAGNVIENSIYNVCNMTAMAIKGMMPTGVHFFPSSTNEEACRSNGLNTGKLLDESMFMAEAVEKDRLNIINFWNRYRTVLGTTDMDVNESMEYVINKYYSNEPFYKKSLNEGAIFSIDSVKGQDYGQRVNTKQLVAAIKKNIRQQLAGTAGKHANAPVPLIWGAPGIGKTSVIKQTLLDLRHSKLTPLNLSLMDISLSGKSIEEWNLPVPEKVPGVGARGKNTPMSWLPVYPNTSNTEELAANDDYFNKALFREGVTEADGFEGGIVFMDEYTRVDDPRVYNVIMNLFNDHKFGDNYTVASKWGFIAAANRATDDGSLDTDDRYSFQAAQNSRLVHYLYVPNKSEWIEWAKQIDPITHQANVPPEITNFIEISEDNVWYAAVKLGSYDHVVDDKDKAHSANTLEDANNVMEQDPLKISKLSYNSRTWAEYIGKGYTEALKTLFGAEKYQELVDQSIIMKTDKSGKSYKEYYGGILPKVLVNALKDLDEDIWEEWYEDAGGDETFNPSRSYYGDDGIMLPFNKAKVLQQYLGQLIREYTNDEEGLGKPTTKWNDYTKYTSIWTKETYQHVLETGEMPEEYQRDDNAWVSNLNDFDRYASASWKQYRPLFDIISGNLVTTIEQIYPGDFDKDYLNDMKRIDKAPDFTEDELEELANQYNKEFAIKGKDGDIELLILPELKKHPERLQNLLKAIKYSDIAKALLHAIQYVIKVCYQTSSNNTLITMEMNLAGSDETKQVSEIEKMLSKETKQYRDFNFIDIRKTSALKSAGTPQATDQLQAMYYKDPISPAIVLIKNAKLYKYNSGLKKVKGK